MRKQLIITVLGLVGIYLLSASGMRIVHHSTDSSDARMIRSDISVFNVNETMIGLHEGDFKVKLNDAEITNFDLSTYQQEAKGVNILLCLDVSGSMRGAPMRAMKNALRNYVSGLRKSDRMAIMTFADDVKLTCDFTGDKTLLLRHVNALQTEGNYTVQYRAGMDAVSKLSGNDNSRIDYLIMIGDGIDTDPNQEYDQHDVIAHAQANAIRVNTIGFYHDNAVYLRILESIAQETGGSYTFAHDEHALNRFLDSHSRDFLNTYVLTVFPDSKTRQGQNTLYMQVSKGLGTADTLITFASETGKAEGSGVNKKTLVYVAIAVLGFLILIIVFSMISKKKKRKRQAEMILRQREAEKDLDSHIEPSPRSSSAYDDTQMSGQPVIDAEPSIPVEALAVKPDLDKTMILGSGSTLTLKFMLGPLSNRSISVSSSGVTIGRADDNTIVIPDPTVSSHHARITCQNGVFMIEDLNSRNGLFIDGNKVQIRRIDRNCSFKFGATEGHITLS